MEFERKMKALLEGMGCPDPLLIMLMSEDAIWEYGRGMIEVANGDTTAKEVSERVAQAHNWHSEARKAK